jgi:formate hydrogenlyase subunit 6/NADH:ubiquinone oxidoreductase subunit I
MKLPKMRELAEAIKALMSRPYTSTFPRTPHVPHGNFRGQPKFDAERCVGCLACEQVCPVDAIGHRDEVNGGVARRVMIHYTDTCIFCGCCEAACIADHLGIALSNDWELSFFDRKTQSFETIEKELALCEVCGDVIACRDHLSWIAERVGELEFSSPTLFHSRLRSMGVIDDNVAAALADRGRSDRAKILCARCRRRTTLTTG